MNIKLCNTLPVLWVSFSFSSLSSWSTLNLHRLGLFSTAFLIVWSSTTEEPTLENNIDVEDGTRMDKEQDVDDDGGGDNDDGSCDNGDDESK